MESVLIKNWLGGDDAIEVVDEASVVLVRNAVLAEATRQGLPTEPAMQLATSASELAHNQLAHARFGAVVVRQTSRDGVAGVEVVAGDGGAGFVNFEGLRGIRRPSAHGLGIGLLGVRDMVDELDVDVRLGEGTCFWARKFAAPGRRRREVGIFGTPHPREIVSGDDAMFVRKKDELFVAIADGLGHGPDARLAANIAVREAVVHVGRPLPVALEACQAALDRTRGVVISLVSIDAAGDLETASLGNVVTCVFGPGVTKRFTGASGILGPRAARRTFPTERTTVGSNDAAIAFTDGISTRLTVGDLSLLREHPVVAAHALMTQFGRGNDDALIVVTR